eukprot:scaffold309_cov235-Pinguiococcus_pyrenoidosus.AAC.29
MTKQETKQRRRRAAKVATTGDTQLTSDSSDCRVLADTAVPKDGRSLSDAGVSGDMLDMDSKEYRSSEFASESDWRSRSES